MTPREIIQRVLTRDHPPRIGFSYSAYDGQPRLNDLAFAGPSADPASRATPWVDDGAGGETQTDEWGNQWRRITGRTTAGEVTIPALQSWGDLAAWQPPSLDDPARYRHLPDVRERCQHLYALGGIHGVAFNSARYLRRLEQYLCDCAETPEMVLRLNRMLNDLAIAQVDQYADAGFDGVFFCEDWGTEDRLLVSPAMWERMFRPDFERLIGHVHTRGMTFWMHSCGYIRDILPSLAAIGADVMQLDQPELSGLDFLGGLGLTIWSPVDIQGVLPTGDRANIERHARDMLAKLTRGGGFIAKDYGDNHSIGVDPLWQHWGYEVFLREGVYQEGQAVA